MQVELAFTSGDDVVVKRIFVEQAEFAAHEYF